MSNKNEAIHSLHPTSLGAFPTLGKNFFSPFFIFFFTGTYSPTFRIIYNNVLLMGAT